MSIQEVKKELNILVVDDDKAFLNLISSLLTKLYPTSVIHRFYRPSEALAFYSRNHEEVDVTLVDMIMPSMDGFRLSQRLKAIDPHEKIILMSAHPMEEMIAMDGADEVDYFITKGKISDNEEGLLFIDYFIRHAFRDRVREIEKVRSQTEIKKMSMIIEKSTNVFFITDVMGNFEYVNPTFEKVTGYTEEDVIGMTPRVLSSGHTSRIEYKKIWDKILSGETWHGTFKNRKRNGEFYWVRTDITPIKTERGEVTHFLAVQEDITERKESVETAQYLVAFDKLTGLFNRGQFLELVDICLSNPNHLNQRGALLIVNLDQFRLLNDTYGPLVGDNFIQATAGLLLKNVKESDLSYGRAGHCESAVARLGSDEFAVILPMRDKKEALDFAEKIRNAIEKYRHPSISAGYAETASIGVVLFPEHGATRAELLTRADAAKYRAKALGRNGVYLYDPAAGDLDVMHETRRGRERIQKALSEDRFHPWFQPIIDLKTGEVCHYEALARMRDEDGTILTPWAFIGIAENFGLISSIDGVMTRKVMKWQAERKNNGGCQISFGMNLSGKNLGNESFLSYLKEAIEETGADPECLVFEITETEAVHDLDAAKKFINSLRAMGCKFSLDDFGVGFTSFLYLREMDVDFIKIDGSFIRNLHNSRNDQLFVKAITDVARGMGIKTIAEFVEKEEILVLLKRMNVDFAQGYHIGKPAPDLNFLR